MAAGIPEGVGDARGVSVFIKAGVGVVDGAEGGVGEKIWLATGSP